MKRKVWFAIALAAILCAGLPVSFLRGDESEKTPNTTTSKPDGLRVQTEDLQPFTHFARIPAGSDADTIRFERAKMVEVPTRITSTTDPKYCEELAFRDPGGSMYCPYTQTGSPTPAYEVTYSYSGQPLPSDEYGDRHFTFQVYFRPDELTPEVRQALSANKKRSRADTAAYFTVNTYRESLRRIVIDEAQSHFCDGNFIDGVWTHSDANCKDEVSYKAITVPSDLTTVRVDPVPAR